MNKIIKIYVHGTSGKYNKILNAILIKIDRPQSLVLYYS